MKKVFTKTIYTIAALFFLVGMSVPAFAQFTLNTITSGAHASAMARDAAGNVYVIEDPSNGTSGGEIVKYTAGTGAGTIIYNGSLISGTDYNGTDDDYAFGITVATNGDIYFTTSNNTGNNFYGNVVKLTFNGGTSYTASVLISGNGNVGYFAGVAIDNANELFVLQYDVAGNSGDGSYEVAKYNTSGVQQSILYDKLETNYALPGTFTAITGLACDPTGTYVYVADWFIENNNSYGGFIEKLTKNGATYTASQLASGTYCTALACDASGNLYATASTYATLSTYKLVEYVGGAGSPVTLYSNLGSDGYNFYPFGIAVESSTSIFVLNGSSGTGTKGDYDQLVGPPTTQASSVSFSSTTENNTVISWTNGGGASRAVFVEAGTTGTPTVSNTTSYTASTTLGNGSTAGSGW